MITVAGMRFERDELQTIDLEDLVGQKLATGHLIYFSAKFDRYFLLLRAGHPITEEFLQKYKEKGVKSFFYLPVFDTERVLSAVKQFRAMGETLYESERVGSARRLLTKFAERYWAQNPKGVYPLEDALVSFEVFSELSEKTLGQLYSSDIDFYFHALESAHFAVYLALSNGILDFSTLQDLYHVCFLLDCSLWLGSLSFHLKQAAFKDWARERDALPYLKQTSSKDLEFYQKHQFESMQRMKDLIPWKSSPLSARWALFHHPSAMSENRLFSDPLLGRVEHIPFLSDKLARRTEQEVGRLCSSNWLKVQLRSDEMAAQIDSIQVLATFCNQLDFFASTNHETEEIA